MKMKDDMIQGKCQLVFISPEQLIGNPKFCTMCQSQCYTKKLVAFVIDEAHCVKKWLVTYHFRGQGAVP